MSLFEQVVGHQRVLDVLGGESGQPAHAYLFVGPSGIGKATVARRFAAGLLCPDGARHAKPCSHCRRVIEGVHPDLVLVEPDGKTALTVDQARATVGAATLAPVEGRRKVFLFEEAGSMNDEAANALLKTLEEPTSSTIFLLVAEAEDELPSTVASRSRVIHFGRVADEDVAQALERLGVEPSQAEEAASIAGGRPGLAMALATRPEVAEFRRAWLGVPMQLSPRPGEAVLLAERVLAAADPLLEALRDRQEGELERLDAHDVPVAFRRGLEERQERQLRRVTQALFVTGLEILVSWYRDAAAAQFGAPVRNRDVPGTALASITPPQAVARAERVFEAIAALRANQRPQLVLSALFADLGALD